MKRYQSLSIFFVVGLLQASQADEFVRPTSPYQITVFLKPLTHDVDEAAKVLGKVSMPGKLTRAMVKTQLRPIYHTGVFAAYGGFCTYSDYNGQISFPRQTTDEFVEYIITQKIKPVLLRGNTVHHFVIPESADAAYFKVERKKAEDQKYDYWHTEAQNLPANRRISPFALIFFAKPNQLMIQEQDIVALSGQNLLLPDIFVKDSITSGASALLFLKVCKYFSPVKFAYQHTKDRYVRLIKPYFAG